MTQKTQNNILIRRYIIVGERRLSNYWWAIVIFLGSCGFLATGICSYLGIPNWLSIFNFDKSNISHTENTSLIVNALTTLPFFPQGLLMSFYGSLGFLLSIYWSLLIFWNVGGGFNEFNKKEGFVRIFRWGYPGKNRKIDLSYSLKDIEAIRVELKQGIDSQRTIYLRLKGKREIPLTGIGQPLTLKEIEKQASELANFLQVSLEA
jgi:Ycf4